MKKTSANMPGCLRIGLIVLILGVSVSMAILYTYYNNGLYKGEEKSSGIIVLTNAQIFRGLEETPISGSLVIQDEYINCVGDCETPQGAEVIDLKGKAVLPGLTDMMTQFYIPSAENRKLSRVQQLLSFTQQRPQVRKNLHLAGITTIRSVGDALENILTLRQQLEESQLAGPRIDCAGLMVTAPGGHPAVSAYKDIPFMVEGGTRLVADTLMAGHVVDELVQNRTNGIKIVYNDFGQSVKKLSLPVLKILIRKARQANLWVSVHTGTNQDIREAVHAGAQIIEYGSTEVLDSLTLSLMTTQQVMLIPGLIQLEPDQEQLDRGIRNVQLARQAGIKIGVGADPQDYLSFGKSLHREMELLVKTGMSPAIVLQAATLIAAVYLKKDDLRGTLEVDKLADVLVVDGTPWTNISDIRKVEMLFQEGQCVVKDKRLID